jgi:peptidoglycan/xylan/chitin deacetylase (PgdA/CDA1 family)
LHVFYFGKRAVLRLIILFCSLALILATGIMTWNNRPAVAPQPGPEQPAPEPIYHGDTGQKTAALTCNVDWGEEILPGMLDLFQAKKVKVTFFVTGRFADKFPDLVKKMAAAGHEIGNHGYEHFHPDQFSREENADEILKAEKALMKAAKKASKLYAPPYGESGARVLLGAADCGYRTILWSIDTVDWQKPEPETIVNRVLDKMQGGDIILMHPTESTLQALPTIIDRLRQDGYRLVTVSEMLKPSRSGGDGGSGVREKKPKTAAIKKEDKPDWNDATVLRKKVRL